MKAWDDQFGDWQGLASDRQAPRYLAIAEMVGRLCPEGSVLDVGCGEAVLRDYLSKGIKYLGIEPSAAALELARAKCGCDSIRHTTAENFDAGGSRWECIVFNEMLYYSRRPLFLLEKYSKLLTPRGIVIVSIYQKGEVGIRARVRHWLDPRRPMSNVHCTKMVYHFMSRHGWLIEGDELIAIPGRGQYWRIWRAEPRTRSDKRP